jgi:hypothetical protein
MLISKGCTVINVETLGCSSLLLLLAMLAMLLLLLCCHCGGAWHHQAMKPHGTFILGEVVRLTDTSATLADGRTVEFDYAAICSGSDYAVGKSNTAVTLDKRRQELKVTDTV